MFAMTLEQPKAKAEVLGWIDQILNRKGWTPTELARKAQLAPSTILRMMNDPKHTFTPSLTTLKKIADGAQVDIPENLMKTFDIQKVGPAAPVRRTMVDHFDPGAVFTSQAGQQGGQNSGQRSASQMVRLRRVSSLPLTLQPKGSPEVMVPRPPQLDGDDTAFAFHMPNTDLEPWIPAGTLVYATNQRDPKSGDNIVLTNKEGRTSVRLLMEMNENGVVLSKSHPVKPDETIPFDEIENIAICAVWVRV
jgi:hypothetical protein